MTLGGLRGRTLLATFGVAGFAAVLVALLIAVPIRAQLLRAIERGLVAEGRLAAALLEQHETDGSIPALDGEADRVGRLTSARVTLIAADGRVVGDSAEDTSALSGLDNHGSRPEVVAARHTGLGIERRFSATLGTNLLYVALRVRHPQVEIVRLALPLTDVDEQFQAVRRSLALALGVALVSALAMAWLSSVLLARRVNAIAVVAQRYAGGDFGAATGDTGSDELGTVARVLDDTAHELGRRMTDLRRADRVRRDFVANVSHELRTPLTAIQGYIEALQDEDPPSPEEARRFLEIIARHAKRMERLVRDLLRLAQLETGRETAERTPVQIEPLFSDVVIGLESAIEAKHQHVATAVDPRAAILQTDGAKLHAALRNLVENAVAYAPASTTIEFAARREGGHVILTVSDEGPGIPEADLARIFERFYRVDKARSRESGGTGLGLAIVKHLVGILGGEVEAANRPAGGAVFSIRLPVT
jgi:signal transduction histidine kinase